MVVRRDYLERYSREEVAQWMGSQASALGAPRLHAVEIYVGMGRITKKLTQKGASAVCIGLKYGHDLRRLRDRELLMCLLSWWDPEHTWVSFPCTAFCCWVSLNEARGCKLDGIKREGGLHVDFTGEIMDHRVDAERHCSLENPWLSRAWRRLAKRLGRRTLEGKPVWKKIRLDQCMTGLRGPQGGLHLKPTGIASTSASVLGALALRCDHTHGHEMVEGKATKPSEDYSDYMGDLASDAMLRDCSDSGSLPDLVPGDAENAYGPTQHAGGGRGGKHGRRS